MCFFKQRTAYEMRISDWRSDVCSSDLCIGLFDGKIVDLERETRGGFAVGRAVIDAFGGPGRMEVEFQNEHLVAREDGRIRALVPDLITIMARETADTITTEQLKYGQRVERKSTSLNSSHYCTSRMPSST